MTTLLLRLAGPMQSWGDSSRFTRRDTRAFPTKSGVLGLLAAAEGRRRTDPIEDLVGLRFGVRVDQPGTVIKDFQTAFNPSIGRAGAVMPLSHRYYLTDAAFLAGVEGERGLLEGLSDALDDPKFPIYLGRRSCPAEGQINLGLTDRPLEEALEAHAWLAAEWYRRTQPPTVMLELLVDAQPGEVGPTQSVRDVPYSFDPTYRDYGWREVAHRPWVEVANPVGQVRIATPASTDWLATLEEA